MRDLCQRAERLQRDGARLQRRRLLGLCPEDGDDLQGRHQSAL